MEEQRMYHVPEQVREINNHNWPQQDTCPSEAEILLVSNHGYGFNLAVRMKEGKKEGSGATLES